MEGLRVPHPPYSPNLTPSNLIFVSLVEKNPQKGNVCRCGGGKQKVAEALKGIKIYKFKNCFEQWEKHLDRCIASNGLL